MRQQQSTVNFMYIKTTLEMSQAIMLLHHENHWVYVFCRSPSSSSAWISFCSWIPLHFLFLSSLPSSIYHAPVSCYSLILSPPLPHLQYFILPCLSSPPLVAPQKSPLCSPFYLNIPFYIFFSPSLSLHLPSTAIDLWRHFLSSSSPSLPSSSPSQSLWCSICMCWMRCTL